MNLTDLDPVATLSLTLATKVHVDHRTAPALRELAAGPVLATVRDTLLSLAERIEAAMNAYQDQIARDAEGWEG